MQNELDTDGPRKVMHYMVGRARMMAAMELGSAGVMDGAMRGFLTRISREEALRLLEDTGWTDRTAAVRRLREDPFALTARMTVGEYDFVRAAFPVHEADELTGLFIKVRGPRWDGEDPDPEDEPLAYFLPDKRSGWCTNCTEHSFMGCKICFPEGLPAPDDLDFMSLLDVPFGTVMELDIPHLPAEALQSCCD